MNQSFGAIKRWRMQIFAITWLAYAAFYFTRKAFSVAKLGIAEDPGFMLDKAAMANLDAIYLAGGNTFVLLHHLRRSGLDEILPQLLDDGMLYLGASAGAAVAGSDIEPLGLMDDPAEAPQLDSTRGLGLVDAVLLPHADGQLPPYPTSLVDKIVSTYGQRFPLQRIDDDQALLVVDGVATIVPSPLG